MKFAYLFFLPYKLCGECLAEEIHHLLLYAGLRVIFYSVAESVAQLYLYACFFKNFAMCCLFLCFACLNVAFGESPMTAVAVAQEQEHQRIALVVIHECAA